MKTRSKLKTTLFLAAALNVSYASEKCFPPTNYIPTLPEVLECFQKGYDAQQLKIGELATKTEKQQEQISKLTSKTEKQQATINTQQGQLAELKQGLRQMRHIQKIAALDMKADTWCAYLTEFKRNSHAVKINSGPGTEVGTPAPEICNKRAIAHGASSGECIKGYTRIAGLGKRYGSFYWTFECNENPKRTNGYTYVCCLW